MSPETLRTLAGATLIAIPLWCLVVVLSFAVFCPVPRLVLAASPARPIAPIAPAPRQKPQPLTGRIDPIHARPEDVETLMRFGYVVKHAGRESVFMIKQLKD